MLEFSLTMEVLSECLDQRINNKNNFIKNFFMSKTHCSLLNFNNNLTLIYCDKISI